jgi:hypothetical protein
MASESLDLTPMDFLLLGFVKDNVYVLRCQHYTSSRHGSERPVQTLIRRFSTTCSRRLNIGLMLLEALTALTLNFINYKLLFIKLFQLVRFKVLTGASMKFRIVFLDVLPCKIIVDRRFRGMCCLHHQGWKQHVPLKRRSTIILPGSTSQKTILIFNWSFSWYVFCNLKQL